MYFRAQSSEEACERETTMYLEPGYDGCFRLSKVLVSDCED
jgi:hypothetical protein